MADYQIAVYLTKSLENDSGYTAQDRAKEYIEGAFDYTPFTVQVLTPYDTLDAPVESSGVSFQAYDLCNPPNKKEYNNLREYFRDWINCDNQTNADDVNLLLSNADDKNGGLGGGKFAVAETGRYIANLPFGYEVWGDTDAHDGMHTALHELGHCLIGVMNDYDGDDVGHHDAARTYDRATAKTMTPMYIHGSENDCEDDYTQSGYDAEELRWSDCAVGNFEES